MIPSNLEMLDPFSMYYNLLKIKYTTIDEILTFSNFIQVGDKVNVFINLETIFRYMSAISDVEDKINLRKDYIELIVSNIVNLAAHYKRFFVANGCDVNVFMYYEDFYTKEYPETEDIPDYRSYYHIKYTQNPKYIRMTELFVDNIFPEVEFICNAVPNVYCIKANNFESGLIPYIIGTHKNYEGYKNIIISSELYETQYSLIPNFMNFTVLKTRDNPIKWVTEPESYIKRMFSRQKDYDIEHIVKTFNSYVPYTTLLAISKDKYRSIENVRSIGPITLYKRIKELPKESFNNPESLCEYMLAPEKDQIVTNYNAISVLAAINRITGEHIDSIFMQIVDKINNNALLDRNKNRYHDHLLMLEALTSSNKKGDNDN